jgi:hypothetical protein
MCVDDVCVVADAPDGGGSGIDASIDGGGGGDRCGTVSVVRDDFEDGVRDRIWDQFADSGTTLDETGGELRIDLAGGTGDPYAGYYTTATYDLRGGVFEAEVPEVGGDATILEIRDWTGPRVQLVADAGVIEAAVLYTADPGIRHSEPYSASAHRYWRISGDVDGTVHWEVSADRTVWTELWSEIPGIDVANVHAFTAAGGQLATASTARFARVNPDAPAAGYCPAASLTDAFADTDLEPEWYWWADNAGCTVSESGGALEMTFLGGADCFSGVQSQHAFDLTESSFTIDAGGTPGVSNFVSYYQVLMIGGDNSDRLEIGHEGNQIYFQMVAGNTDLVNDGALYDATDDRWWRIRGSGGRVYLDTSPDGATWNNRVDELAPFDVSAVTLVVGAGNYNPLTLPAVVTWDSLN